MKDPRLMALLKTIREQFPLGPERGVLEHMAKWVYGRLDDAESDNQDTDLADYGPRH